MRPHPDGKRVHLEVEFWMSENGSIYLTSNEPDGFLAIVDDDPSKQNGHPGLYGKLAECLRVAGAPAPARAAQDDTRPI